MAITSGYWKIQEIHKFERTINLAKLKALSKISLERQLTDNEFKEMKALSKKVF